MNSATTPAWAATLPVRVQTWPIESQVLILLLRAAFGTTPSFGGFPKFQEAELLKLIRRHRVGAFLATHLPAEVTCSLPPPLSDQLLKIALKTRVRAQRQTAAAVQLASSMAAAGVPALGLKGPFLAERLYGRQGIRHAGDIDFVIAEASVERADALLENAGFQRTHPVCPMTPRRWREYTRVWRDAEYRHADSGLVLEVMWRLANSDQLQAEVCRAAPVRQRLGNQEIEMLPDELHGLYLLVHGAHHGWFRLFWLLDIALLMRDDAVDWPALLALAERTGNTRSFWQGVWLAREIFGIPLPAVPAAGPPDESWCGLMDDAYWHMERTPEELRFGATHLRMAAYAARLQPDPTIRQRERSKRWVSPENWALLPLPDRLLPLHRILWPGLWAWRQMMRRLRSDLAPRQPD